MRERGVCVFRVTTGDRRGGMGSVCVVSPAASPPLRTRLFVRVAEGEALLGRRLELLTVVLRHVLRQKQKEGEAGS